MARDLGRRDSTQEHPVGRYFTVHREGEVVCVSRTDEGFATLAEVGEAHQAIIDALTIFRGPDRRLLLDLRKAPSRNDEGFERAIAPYRPKFLGGWKRVAIIVRSVVGGLQVRRHAQEDGTAPRIFDDPAEARRWAEGS